MEDLELRPWSLKDKNITTWVWFDVEFRYEIT